MTFEEFSRRNRARCEAADGFDHPLSSWSTAEWFLAVYGELGEAANFAKKLNRERDGVKGNKVTGDVLREKLRREIGDTFVYLDLLAQSLGFSLGEAAGDVFDSKSAEIGYAERLERLDPDTGHDLNWIEGLPPVNSAKEK